MDSAEIVELERASNGKCQSIPQAQERRTGSPAVSLLHIENAAGYAMRVVLRRVSPDTFVSFERTMDVPPSIPKSLALAPGTYLVFGRIDSPHEVPSFGSKPTYEADTGYTVRFYLSTAPRDRSFKA